MKEMTELAEMAVETARFWGLELDYSAESLDLLDTLAQKIYRLNINQPVPEEYLLSAANLYGAYLGEVLLRSGLDNLGFAWVRNGEGEIGIGRDDFLAFPVTKAYKRITRGPEHSLMSFFEMVFGLAIGAVDPDDPRMHVLSEEAL